MPWWWCFLGFRPRLETRSATQDRRSGFSLFIQRKGKSISTALPLISGKRWCRAERGGATRARGRREELASYSRSSAASISFILLSWLGSRPASSYSGFAVASNPYLKKCTSSMSARARELAHRSNSPYTRYTANIIGLSVHYYSSISGISKVEWRIPAINNFALSRPRALAIETRSKRKFNQPASQRSRDGNRRPCHRMSPPFPSIPSIIHSINETLRVRDLERKKSRFPRHFGERE